MVVSGSKGKWIADVYPELVQIGFEDFKFSGPYWLISDTTGEFVTYVVRKKGKLILGMDEDNGKQFVRVGPP